MYKILGTMIAVVCVSGGLAFAAPAAPAACSGTIQVASVTFDPSRATPGQTVTASVAAENCTDQPQQASEMVVARFTGTGNGVPAGCPVIDPLPPRTISFPPDGSVTSTYGYLMFSGCAATGLQVTAQFRDGTGAVVATGSAELPIGPAATCAVSYQESSRWPGGFTAVVTITDLAPTTIEGWSLTWQYPGDQRITSAWDATVRQSGAAVTARNARWDGTVAPAGSVTFGLTGRWHADDTPPTGFAVNGAPCTAPSGLDGVRRS